MSRFQKPLQILVYQDVLCAWCFVAERRIEILKKDLGDAVRWIRRSYPLRLKDTLPSAKEIDGWVKEVEQARKEPEGRSLSPELWTSLDKPRSSLNALCAIEAAKLQGAEAGTRMAVALQRAALEQGVNVTRSDVLFEIASNVGLEMNRFSAAFQSPETKRLILEEHRIASERGVKGVPALVIDGRWMLSGLRDFAEYREEILSCVHKAEHARITSADRVVH